MNQLITGATLPPLDPVAKSISDALSSQIQRDIQQNGPILFSQFMSAALYAPELGYYRNAFQKFGGGGDFVTAPEISALYSACIARQCAEVLEKLSGGDIFEFGAGSGMMAADILQTLHAMNILPKHYYILELSAHLKALQRETIFKKIPTLCDRVIWLERLPEKPMRGVVIANEVLDAMPVELFTWENGPIINQVDFQKEQFILIRDKKINRELQSRFEQYQIAFKNGYTSEVNLYLPAWIKSIAEFFSAGLLLLIDYGFPRREYYHPDRDQGTLMCHYRHRAHTDPFVFPGMQDITAHVDFTAVAEAAFDHHFSVAGFTNQASFLINCGLLSLVQQTENEKYRVQQNQQVLKLTSPAEMGELFKVMALTKNIDPDLGGFSNHNQLARLS